MSKEEEWAKNAAHILKEKMSAEEIDVIKTNLEVSIPIAGQIRSTKGRMDATTRSIIKAENAANKLLNDYYTNLIRKYL